MKLKEAKEKILGLIDEPQDNEINQLLTKQIDSVQREIACMVKELKREEKINVVNGRHELSEGINVYEATKLEDEKGRIANFILKGSTIFAKDGEYLFYYNAYPKKITNESDENEELEISEECCEALIYGVAAALCMDDAGMYDTFLSKYSNMLINIQNRGIRNIAADIKGGFLI